MADERSSTTKIKTFGLKTKSHLNLNSRNTMASVFLSAWSDKQMQNFQALDLCLS